MENSGDVHIWQTSSPDNWAAFAPGFEELEENVEYDEREDEFDIVSVCEPRSQPRVGLASAMGLPGLYGTTRRTGGGGVGGWAEGHCAGRANTQEDEDDAARKMNEAEDEDIDVLTPAGDYPRRPEPALGAAFAVTSAPGGEANGEGAEQGEGEGEGEAEDEATRAARLVKAAAEWADARPDADGWEGFYLSLDLVEEPLEDENGG